MDWLDGSLYPDLDAPPTALLTLGDQIDFIARLCGAWDFGILPELETLAEVRRAEWRAAIDQCNMRTSVAYQLLREWHGLPALPFLGSIPAYILEDPSLHFV